MIRLSAIGAVVAVLACAASVGAQAMQPERLIMVKEADKPAQKCRVLKCWKDKAGSKVCQVQAVDSGEMMTIVEEGGTITAAPTKSTPTAQQTKVIHWGGQTTCPNCAPAAPANAVVCGTPKPPAKPSTWDRMFVSSKPRVSTQAKVSSVETPVANQSPVVSSAIAKPVKATTPPAGFGKVERWSDDDARMAADAASARANARSKRMGEPPIARVEKETKPVPVEVVKSTPVAKCECSKAQCNECKHGKSLSETLGLSKSSAPVVKEVKKVEPVRPVPVVVKKDEPSLWSRLTTSSQPKPVPVTAPKESDLPPGMGSWMAAATTPPAPPATPSVAVPASARNAFTTMMPGLRPGQMPTMMPMMSEAGVPEGMGNAFTMAGSARPIPSDMGRNYAVPNAMQGGGRMGGAENRPPFPGGYYQQVQGTLPPLPPAQVPAQMPAAMPALMPVSATVPVTPVTILRDSVMPSERELAVEQLSRCDWKSQPEVIEVLVKSAKSDPAATVRVACLQALVRMKVNTMPAVNAALSLKSDPDIRVRQQAEQTLAVLMKP